MNKFARIIEGVAIEVITLAAGQTLGSSFHPDVAAQFESVPDDVTPGSKRESDGRWTIEPIVTPALLPDPAPERRVTILAFLQRFTLGERLSIRAARASDAVVDDFMSMVDAATFIDLDRPDTEQGVAYLVSKEHVTAERAETILTAEVQQIERPQ